MTGYVSSITSESLRLFFRIIQRLSSWFVPSMVRNPEKSVSLLGLFEIRLPSEFILLKEFCCKVHVY